MHSRSAIHAYRPCIEGKWKWKSSGNGSHNAWQQQTPQAIFVTSRSRNGTKPFSNDSWLRNRVIMACDMRFPKHFIQNISFSVFKWLCILKTVGQTKLFPAVPFLEIHLFEKAKPMTNWSARVTHFVQGLEKWLDPAPFADQYSQWAMTVFLWCSESQKTFFRDQIRRSFPGLLNTQRGSYNDLVEVSKKTEVPTGKKLIPKQKFVTVLLLPKWHGETLKWRDLFGPHRSRTDQSVLLCSSHCDCSPISVDLVLWMFLQGKLPSSVLLLPHLWFWFQLSRMCVTCSEHWTTARTDRNVMRSTQTLPTAGKLLNSWQKRS